MRAYDPVRNGDVESPEICNPVFLDAEGGGDFVVDPALKTKLAAAARRLGRYSGGKSRRCETRPAGVNVTPRERLGVASILTRRGGEAALSAVVSTRYGLDLPMIPRAVHGEAHAFVWAGPRT